ncbi:hypothetical protein NW768_006038 [Fusarium equiseti]|uniref:Uncharacterized protein n=1 Tax=Fusarium equiseti TaxID=61235 RepID=A0ABQ8RDN4_FUSEQ|nr:hypothetical protein NW768_006038 [Fusarium equiseti]
MASNTSAASCAQPPLSLLVENPHRPTPLKEEDKKAPESSGSSSSGNLGKSFLQRTQQKLKDAIFSSNSCAVSSVDGHTPPIDIPKAKINRILGVETTPRIDIVPRGFKPIAQPPSTHVTVDFSIPENDLSQAMRKTWARFPPPPNQDFPVDEVFNFTPKCLAQPTDPEALIDRFKEHTETSFTQPIAIQSAIRHEYMAHLVDEKQEYDKHMNTLAQARHDRTEMKASKSYQFGQANEPFNFPGIGPKNQKELYEDNVNIAALSRKVAKCDGTIQGIIAGEFIHDKDTAHLPLTEEQMAVLRESADTKDLFPEVHTEELSLYDQWLKDQSDNACPVADWLKDEEKFAKKKAFKDAFSKQLEFRFPSKQHNYNTPSITTTPDGLVWETDYFPYMLPKTTKDPERYNMYEIPLSIQVPKWFPAFVDSGILPFDKNRATDKQYKELLTTIWKLESQMLKGTKPGKQAAASGNAAWILKNKYDNFNESKRYRDLTETDVVVGEFSFDDAFGYGDDIEVKTHSKQAKPKKPEAFLKEIAEGVKKAIAKVGR